MRKTLKITGILLIMLFSADGFDEARAEAYVSFDLFYQSLDPYGGWVDHPDFGYVWYPVGVGAEWQPYSDGRWEYSDRGWIWVSYEPWGWATYHYGRWVFDQYYGWVWIPGVEWAPSYVTWYDSPGYVGWAPLPPDNNFFLSIGLFFGGGGYYYDDYYYRPYYYGGHYHHKKHHHDHHNHYYVPDKHVVYVPEKHFHNKNTKFVRVDHDNIEVVHRNVKNLNREKVYDAKFSRHGPDRRYMEKKTNTKFDRLKIEDKNATVYRGKRNTVNNGKYNAYRPRFDYKQKSDKPFNRSVAKGNFNRGDVKKNPAVTNRDSGSSERGVKKAGIDKSPGRYNTKKKSFDRRNDRIGNKFSTSRNDQKRKYEPTYQRNNPDKLKQDRKSEYPYPKNTVNRNRYEKKNDSRGPSFDRPGRQDFRKQQKASKVRIPENKYSISQQKSYDKDYKRNTGPGKSLNRIYKQPEFKPRENNYSQKSYKNQQNSYKSNLNQYRGSSNKSYNSSNKPVRQNRSYNRSANKTTFSQKSYQPKSYNRGNSFKGKNSSKSFSRR